MSELRRDQPVLIDGNAQSAEWDEDVEMAWDSFREALRGAESPGTIRLAKIPVNDDGTPAVSAKGQIQLASYPVDQYNYDELLNVVRSKFMRPGESIFVRMMAFETGKAGARFNRIVNVMREAAPDAAQAGAQSNFGEFAKILRDAQEHNTALIRELTGNANPAPRGVDWVGMFEKIGPIAAPIVAAWLSRPRGASSDLAGIVTVFKELQTMAPGGAAPVEEDSTASIIKSVAGPGLQFLTALAQGRHQAPAPQARLPNPAAQTLFPTAPTTPAPSPPNSTPVQPAGQDAAAMMAQIKPYLEQLTEMAANHADADEAAKLAFDMLPEELDQAIYQVVSTPQSFARLKLICPKMGNHAEWFEKFRVATAALFANDAGAA